MKRRFGIVGRKMFLTCLALFAIILGASRAQADVQPVAPGVSGSQVQTEESMPWFERLQDLLVYDTFAIHPRYQQDFLFDGNALLETSDQRYDTIFREAPGAQLIVPFQKHRLKVDYDAEFEQFVKFPQENAENQYFRTEGAFNFSKAFARINEGITDTSSRSGTTFTTRVHRFEHFVNTNAGYRFDRFTVEGGYDDFYRSFNSSPTNQFSYHANKFHTKLLADVTHKTQAFTEYAWTRYNYFKDAGHDGNGNEIYGGLQSKLLPKTTFYSKFGYEHIGYSQGNDANDFVSEIGANYQPTRKSNVNLGWVRSTEQSTFSTANAFTQDVLFGRIGVRLTDKITGRVRVSYANQDYSDSTSTGAGTFRGKRDDDLFSTAIGASYRLTKWLTSDLEYQYNRRNSNAPAFDYAQNLLDLSIKAEI